MIIIKIFDPTTPADHPCSTTSHRRWSTAVALSRPYGSRPVALQAEGQTSAALIMIKVYHKYAVPTIRGPGQVRLKTPNTMQRKPHRLEELRKKGEGHILPTMLQIKPIFFVLAFGLSCAKIKTINLREHDFNQQPQNIIWLQVAGLASEHLAMLKFSLPDPGQMISFENHQCLGEMWGFNLFKIRPKASEGFLSQMTGSQNIKGHCLGEQAKPLWNDFQKRGWHTGIIELGANQKNSIVPSQKCHQENPQFYQNTIVWLMHDWPKSFAAPFHFQLSQSFEMGKVYYDKSCKKSSCFSGAFNNIKAIWEKTLAPPESSLFIIRDFRHLEALKRKNILRAREILVELEKIHTYFSKIDKTLIVVSGSGTQNFEFPSQGKSWASFEKKGKNIIYRRSALLSPVYAQGPRSENFCGIFNESEIPKRMLWSPPKRVLW